MQKITPFLWFDGNAEEAMNFYVSEGNCGWLKDKYGLSWQIVPKRLPELLADSNPEKSRRVMEALLKMIKIDIAALEAAAAPPLTTTAAAQ